MTNTISSLAPVPAPAYSYEQFRALVGALAAEARTSGPDQAPGLIRSTHHNQTHLDRAHARPPLPRLVATLAQLPQTEHWLVLGEAWCLDTAHLVPLLARLAEESAGRIRLHVLLRSDHPALMEAHQTDGANNIPKLIRLDQTSGVHLGDWGPRPAAAKALAHRLHADKALPASNVTKTMNAWYEADNGEAMQQELLALLS